MPAEFLQLLSDTLESGLADAPATRRRQSRDDAPGGPLWSVDVPKSKEIVSVVIAFAKRGGELEFKANDIPVATGRLASIRAERSTLIVSYDKKWFSGSWSHETQSIPYPDGENGNVAKLCRGEVVAYGACTAQLKDPDLIFDATFQNGAAKIEWDNFEISRPGIIRRRFYKVEHFLIGPETGRLVLGSKFWSWVLPDLRWQSIREAA